MTKPQELIWYTPRPKTDTVTAIQWENGGVAMSRFEHWLETLGIKETQVYYQADVPKNRRVNQGSDACLFIINPDGRPGSPEGWTMARPTDWIIWTGEKLQIVDNTEFQFEWRELDGRTPSEVLGDAISDYERHEDVELTAAGMRKLGVWFSKAAEALASALERREAGEELIPDPKAPTLGLTPDLDASIRSGSSPSSEQTATSSSSQTQQPGESGPKPPTPLDWYCGLAAPHEPHSVTQDYGRAPDLQCAGFTSLQYGEWEQAVLNVRGRAITALPWGRCTSTVQHGDHAWLKAERAPGDWMYCEGSDTDPKAFSTASTGSNSDSWQPSVSDHGEPCALEAVHAKHTWTSIVTGPDQVFHCPGMTGSEYTARTGMPAGYNVTGLSTIKCDSRINHMGHPHTGYSKYCVGRIPSDTDLATLTEMNAV